MKAINLNRQLIGVEDLLIGFGIVTQIRGGQEVNITQINAGSLPFNETQTLLQWAESVNLSAIASMLDEIAAIAANEANIKNVANNEVNINQVSDLSSEINTLYSNIEAIQTNSNNIAIINDVYNNKVNINQVADLSSEINTLYSNIEAIQTNSDNIAIITGVYNNEVNINQVANLSSEINTLHSNIDAIQTNSDNIAIINEVYNNLTQLISIYTNIIPNLTEILNVDALALQVTQDKIDISAMKLAVETIYDTFDDRFLGAKPTDPSIDNDGNPLIDGAMYFNNSANSMKVYSLATLTWYTIPQLYLAGLLDVQLTSIATGDILTWDGLKWVNTKTPSFDSVKFNGSLGTAGVATWNTDDETIDLVLDEEVTLQVGQELLVRGKNTSGLIIPNGTVLMSTGAVGNSGIITVGPHDGTRANGYKIAGIATESLDINEIGFSLLRGKLRGINCTGTPYGEVWNYGDAIWVSPSGNGAMTNIQPNINQLKMFIGIVINNTSNGTLQVRTNGVDDNHFVDYVGTIEEFEGALI